MKKLSVLSFIGLLFVTVNGQYAFSKQWDRRFGGRSDDGCNFFLTTSDSGLILGGSSQSGMNGDKTQPNWDTTLQFADYWVVKIDKNGNKQWDKRYGGYSEDHLNKIIQTVDGFVFGGSSGTTPAGADKTEAGRGNWDYWIVKTDAQGNKLWDRRYGGVSQDYLHEIRQTRDSGYILGGYSSSPVGGDKTQPDWDATGFYWDYWVVKIDSLGNKQWDKRFGGMEDDDLFSIIQTPDEGYMLFGSSASDSTGDKTQHSKGYRDYWIVKIDSTGNKEWDKSFGGSNGDYLSTAISISGGYLLGGKSYSDSGGDKTQNNWSATFDYWIIKIDSSGNKIWDKTFGSFGADGLCQITLTTDGGFLLTGVSAGSLSSGGDKSESNLGSSQTWLVKLDSLGNKEWDKTIFTIGSEGLGLGIQTLDGCYVAGGYTEGGIGGYKTQPNWDINNLTFDYWVIKFCMDTVTGINEITEQPQIVVYPNPFTSDISISLQIENLHQATFTISNLVGQTIYRREETNLANNYTKMLDLSYLPTGMYLLTVTTDGYRISKQIIKQ